MTSDARTNIYKIVDNTRPTVRPITVGTSKTRRERVMPFLKTPLRVLRWIIYYVMMWVRPVVRFVTHAVAIPCILIALVAFGIGDTARPQLPYLFLAASFMAFLAGWFYDTAVLVIAPERIELH